MCVCFVSSSVIRQHVVVDASRAGRVKLSFRQNNSAKRIFLMPCLLFPSIRAIVTIYFGHCINTLPQNYTTEIQRNIIRSNVEREVDIVVYKN